MINHHAEGAITRTRENAWRNLGDADYWQNEVEAFQRKLAIVEARLAGLIAQAGELREARKARPTFALIELLKRT